MDLDNVLVSRHGAIGRISLNRPDRINALSLDLLSDVIAALGKLSGDPAVRVIVIEGSGRGFSVGHDLNEMIERSEEFFEELFGTCTVMMEEIRRIPQPVIAKVHGIAAAAGCQLVAACDLAVAAEGTRFGTTGLKVGLFCSTPMVPLSRSIGRKRALEMLLTGDTISAETAAEWGLINRVVSPEDLESEVTELANQIAEYSGEVVGIGKAAFYRQVEMAESDAYAMTKDVIAANALARDGQEGMSAFLEKRSPEWNQD